METVGFYHPQHAFGFGSASTRSFSIQPGIFFFFFIYICFYFKRRDQLRVITRCVLKVFLPVRIRLKAVRHDPLENDQMVLSASYADLSAFLHLCSVWAK